jgi:hypothetical protein
MKIRDMDAFLAEYKELCQKHKMQINVAMSPVGLIDDGLVVEPDLEFLDENIEFISKITIKHHCPTRS